MSFIANIKIMPSPGKMDKNGKSVEKELKAAQVKHISNVIVGRHYTMEVEANSKNAALAFADDACKALLNSEEEVYEISVSVL